MQESPDYLSVYKRIGFDDSPHCRCGGCKCCNARGASKLAIDHLAQLMPGNPHTCLAIDMANIFLNPGRKNTSTLARYLQEDFGESITETMLQAAAEFRKCETREEASEVARKFPIPIVV